MAEDELIWAMLGAWYRGEDWETCPPGTSEKQNADFVSSVTRDMARVLAVVREYDAARVPADAELDALIEELRFDAKFVGSLPADQDKARESADAITALRTRVAALEGRADA